MTEQDDHTDGGISRRSVTKAAVWAVPVGLLAAPVPAMAASNASGSVIARCGSGAQAAFDIAVVGADNGTAVQVVLSSPAGTGSFGVTAPAAWGSPAATSTSYTYVVPTVGGALTGTATVNFTLGQNGTATVTATVAATSGTPLAGDLSGSVFKRRDGNSGNYQCSVS